MSDSITKAAKDLIFDMLPGSGMRGVEVDSAAYIDMLNEYVTEEIPVNALDQRVKELLAQCVNGFACLDEDD